VRQAHGTDGATTILSRGARITADQARHVDSLLAGARPLNPDREVDILRGEAALERGQTQTAQRILGQVARAEPQNLEAWLWLAHSAGSNRPLFYRALVQVRKLEPVVRPPS
jgi:predicted Zn-dependent protease